jgi:hypothetical protein
MIQFQDDIMQIRQMTMDLDAKLSEQIFKLEKRINDIEDRLNRL